MKAFAITLSLLLSLFLTGCAKDISPNTYRDAHAGEVSQVLRGVIVDKRVVNVKGNSGVGTIAGGAAGAVAGSSIGGGRGSALASIAGAVVGGIAGNAVDERVNTQQGFEYIVDLDNGQTQSVVQGASDLRVGDRVLFIQGPKARLVRAR